MDIRIILGGITALVGVILGIIAAALFSTAPAPVTKEIDYICDSDARIRVDRALGPCLEKGQSIEACMPALIELHCERKGDGHH